MLQGSVITKESMLYQNSVKVSMYTDEQKQVVLKYGSVGNFQKHVI